MGYIRWDENRTDSQRGGTRLLTFDISTILMGETGKGTKGMG